MGSKEGAAKALKKLREKYTEEEIKAIRSKGGKNSATFSDPEIASRAALKRWNKKDKEGEK